MLETKQDTTCVFVCMQAYVRVCEKTCAKETQIERERERERKRESERERKSVSLCVCVRENVCVCVRVWFDMICVRGCVSMCVCTPSRKIIWDTHDKQRRFLPNVRMTIQDLL